MFASYDFAYIFTGMTKMQYVTEQIFVFSCAICHFQNLSLSSINSYNFFCKCACFGSTYTKIGTIQRRLAWPLRKDDTQNREAFHIFVSAFTFYLIFLFYFCTFYTINCWVMNYLSSKNSPAVPSVRGDAGSSPGQENEINLGTCSWRCYKFLYFFLVIN